MNYYLAIDIGASSGRHILGHMENGSMILEEMYRFDNRQVRKNGHDCWDMDNLWDGIISGLKACKAAGKIPVTVGIDTWAVDYVLLDENDEVLGDVVAYRDSRTEGMGKVVGSMISPEALYARTGIQKQPFNTIYQLMAQRQESPGQLERAKWFLMIPEYFHFRLTGVKQNEYTNATSTNLVNAEDKTWDKEIISALGLPAEIFHELAMPGTVVGNLLPEIRELVGFDTTVVLPATHDTGSAFLAIPARDENAVYLSSGTWSLLGVENERPITTPESQAQNFTNEGGAWYRYRYLKNIMGLWMIQSIRRELNGAEYVLGKTQNSQKKELQGQDHKDPEHKEPEHKEPEHKEPEHKAQKFKNQELESQEHNEQQRNAETDLQTGQTFKQNAVDQPAEKKKSWGFPELIAAAREARNFNGVVDVNRDCFLAPASMIQAIRGECARTGQPVPETVGELMQCVYNSLSICYRDAIKSLEKLTGKHYTSINIVGGGCQDMYLNELTAKAAGLPVYAGPVEGTAIGNLIVQMVAAGEVKDLQAARDIIRRSFEIKEVNA